MDFEAIIYQIIVLFLVLFVGYFVRKVAIIDDHTSKKISGFIVNVTAPMLILSSMMRDTKLGGREIIGILSISIIVYICLFLTTLIVPRVLGVEKHNLGVYKFMIMFSNVGFMGFPVVSSIFGDEAIFYASIFNLPFYALVYTLGIYFVSMNNKERMVFKFTKMLNPGVVAVIIGLFIFSFNWKVYVPVPVRETLNMIGGLTTPLSMIVIGASLAHVKIRNIFANVRLYVYCVLKLVVFPVVILLIIRQFHFNPIMMGVPVIITGMPVAANAVILSKEFGGNDVLASEGVFISTMLSILSIPLMVYLLSLA